MNASGITKAAEVLTVQLQDLQEQVKDLKKSNLNDALTGWFLTREEYDALDLVRKEIHKVLDDLSYNTLPEMMAEADTKTTTIVSLRRRFTVNLRVSCSMLDKDAGMEWLRSTGNEAIIQPTVNAGTLSSFAKYWVQEQGKELPETIFKVSTQKIMSATKV